MTKKRPVGITVFAILNLVFGGLGLVGSLCGAVMLVATPALLQQTRPANPQPGGGRFGGLNMEAYQKHLEANVPGYAAMQWGSIGLTIVLYTVLIIAGIALLRMIAAGRWLSIIYSLLEIVMIMAVAIHNFVVVAPAAEEFFRQQGEGAGGLLAGISTFSGCPCMLYSVVLLIFMVLPSTGAAFTPSQLGDFPERAGEDYDDQDYRRERRVWPPES